MSLAELPLETLRKVPLFENLNDEELRHVTEAAALATYSPGELVLCQGKRSQNLWIVLEGVCEVIKQPDGETGELVLATLEAFDNFGEMSFFNSAPHSAGVRAKTHIKLLRISREAYDELIQNGRWAAYKLAYNSVESLAIRLRRMDEWVARLTRDAAQSSRVQEWSSFRDKLFTEWNL